MCFFLFAASPLTLSEVRSMLPQGFTADLAGPADQAALRALHPAARTGARLLLGACSCDLVLQRNGPRDEERELRARYFASGMSRGDVIAALDGHRRGGGRFDSPADARAALAAASATSIPAISVNSAALVANGAAIRVVFTATCGAGDDGSVSSTITQAAGDRVAQGATQTSFTCTGKPQQVSALAAANVNGAPFRPGIAVVTASVGDCPSANCTGASTDKVLSIRR